MPNTEVGKARSATPGQFRAPNRSHRHPAPTPDPPWPGVTAVPSCSPGLLPAPPIRARDATSLCCAPRPGGDPGSPAQRRGIEAWQPCEGRRLGNGGWEADLEPEIGMFFFLNSFPPRAVRDGFQAAPRQNPLLLSAGGGRERRPMRF